jgi:hypothetical protein
MLTILFLYPPFRISCFCRLLYESAGIILYFVSVKFVHLPIWIDVSSSFAAIYLIVYCFQLANTEEYIDGQFSGNLGEILIR